MNSHIILPLSPLLCIIANLIHIISNYEKAIKEIRTSHCMYDATVLYHVHSCRPGAVLV